MKIRHLVACCAAILAGCATVERVPEGPWRVVSEATIAGFVFPESVGCDRGEGVLYVSQFGGTQLAPLARDGQGFISKLAPDGRILEAKAFPEVMNKPKGIWVDRGRLWVTDIDGVWVFDTRSKKGRKLPLPGAQFANDPAVSSGVLYVSDNRADQVFKVEPADFLDAGVQPKVTVVSSKKEINPNGLWPARDGSVLVVGWEASGKARGIHAIGPDGEAKPYSQPIGQLDGVYELRDGSGLLVTDWKSGTLARDFKGPADFCVLGTTVYVPDLVKSELRVVRLGK